jgi:ribosomal protein S18 acetylase RimI-like enzyme
MTDEKTLDVEVGLARPEELADIWELYRRTYLDTYIDEKAGITKQRLMDFLATDSPWFPKNWQRDLEGRSKTRTVYVARHQGKVVGLVAPIIVDNKRRITALYVAPEVQGMRIGTKLMKVALSCHGNFDVYVGIASHIKQLQKFYEHFGFKVVDPNRRMQYPPDPMSYIEMIRLATID